MSVKKLVIKFVWVQMTNFIESFLSTYTLSNSAPRRIDVDLMLILHRYVKKENINKFPISSSFWRTFSM